MSLKFLPCGTFLVTSGADKFVRVWDPATGRLVDSKRSVVTGWHTSHYDIDAAQYLPGISKDCYIFTPGIKEGQIQMMNMNMRIGFFRSLHSLQPLMGHMRMVQAMKYIPFQNKLLTAGSDGMVYLWEPKKSDSSGDLEFIGEDPLEDVQKRRGSGIPTMSNDASAFSDSGNRNNLEDIDLWSDGDEEPAEVHRNSSGLQVSSAEPSGSIVLLPPIIRQILDDEADSANTNDFHTFSTL